MDFERIPFCATDTRSSAEIKMEPQQSELDTPENGFSHPPITVQPHWEGIVQEPPSA